MNLHRPRKKKLPKRKKEPVKAPEMPNECWAMDFTSNNFISVKSFCILNILDEFNRESLGIEVDTSLPAERVVRILNQSIEWRGYSQAIRMDNGPGFISEKMEESTKAHQIELKFFPPGKPTKNPRVFEK